jgi:hypothetical protein
VHVCAARRGAAKDGALSFAADCDGEQATGRSAKVRDLIATILIFGDCETLEKLSTHDFAIVDFLLIVSLRLSGRPG